MIRVIAPGVDWPTIFVTENEQRGFISFVVIASPANLGSVDIVKIQYSPKDRDKAQVLPPPVLHAQSRHLGRRTRLTHPCSQHLQAISRDISEIFKDTIYASWSAKGIDMLQESGSEKPASSDTDDSLCSICSGRLTDAGSSLLSPPPAPCGASCPPGPDDTVQRSIQHGDQLLQSIREEEEERSAAEVRRRDRNKVKRQNDRSRRRLQQEKAREEAASAREAEERHTMLVLKEQVREEKRLNKKRAVQAHLQRLRQAGVYTEAAGTPCGALSDTAAGSCSADSATCEGLSRTGAGSCSADSATREGLSRTDAIEQRAALSECVICLTAGVSFCVLPCLHVVYCEGCAQHLQYEILLSCPMCFSTDGVGGYDMRFDGKHVHCAPWRDGEAFFGREAFVRESL